MMLMFLNNWCPTRPTENDTLDQGYCIIATHITNNVVLSRHMHGSRKIDLRFDPMDLGLGSTWIINQTLQFCRVIYWDH